MMTKDNGFDLNIEKHLTCWRRYAFVSIVLFLFLSVIYYNSFDGAWQFDDRPNIVENGNIFLKTFDWNNIKNTFYAPDGGRISRPLAYLSFALNYYFGGLDVLGYHIVNLGIHYLTALFLFLFIYNTLNLPTLRNRYGIVSYEIALLATFLWATSPVQVTAVTYLVQRMASMSGLFYIMALYFYLKGRVAEGLRERIVFWGVCIISTAASISTKENAAMLPVSIWLYDLLLIQGVTGRTVTKNIKLLLPAVVVLLVAGFIFADISTLLSGYQNRPFTLTERLLTEPRIIIWYITLLLYPVSSRLTLIHDIDLSRSPLLPWETIPSIALIIMAMALAFYLSRKRPVISFCIFFFFMNHIIEGSFIPLELIYEHRNYIPSMLFFIPVAIFLVNVLDYFSYKKAIQLMVAAAVGFFIFAQGHTVFVRNNIFKSPLYLWSDNVEKTPTLSRPYNNLGAAYWDLGRYEEAYEAYSKALEIDGQTNLLNRGVNLYNLGVYHLYVKGEYDKALELFNSALEVYRGYWPSHHEIAICLILKGDIFEAGKKLLVALSSWPDNAALHHAMGFVMLKAGKYDDAIKEARLALALDPKLYNALSVLAEAFRGKGSYGAARVYWERYLEKNPDDLEGNLALVTLYAREGDRNALSRTIGKIMCLKGSVGWHEYIGSVLKDTRPMAYRPDIEALVRIVSEDLTDQVRR